MGRFSSTSLMSFVSKTPLFLGKFRQQRGGFQSLALPHTYSPQNPPTDCPHAKQAEELVSQLSPQEVEVAAKAFYEYLKQPNPEHTLFYAKQYARGFLKAFVDDTGAKRADMNRALKRIKETIQFRTEMDVDTLRTLFDPEQQQSRANSKIDDTNKQSRLKLLGRQSKASSSRALSKAAQRLAQEMKYRNVYVQGHDIQGRSTYVFVPRNVRGHDQVWTMKQHVYTLERAVASSRAPDKTVNAVVDFNGFSPAKNAPPTSLGRTFIQTFGNHYGSSIHNVFLVDAPASFLCFWAILKPLLGKKARRKIHFVKSSQSNELAKFYTPDQAASWMMQGGQKNRELDVDEYLCQTPFYKSFDDSWN